ncbi:ribose-5-phosphate isomerase [Candidatus Azambacteria bacterium RIFCSPHIGHO2_02_FULL_52_12]|uniref:Ribose-5-phosphate isomerase n=1 Tax=Candidatus Azambacteria bacterium RIFCSPLOWO2_01_FULL_46_25 TaxID=1797298 RepID=A0A1F5BVY8_9BACT|nr:MAG: ribose-5-phosphate isomerase [Candidatus Azambacteria bacterium RIFCSPHIGHO2_02_FULL_52_12]OGD34765.1 MAG: ribose-5-phosphate isomerase [Candidatus Azambacteria bacterium RIFCSPLOWO2_01_FULL_46_25]OGD37890.1 MAG: ribose-5-phosphate isomerase [Candidatus Azambacteria bacterium RIFCSPHIGHO2_01_FULL_51_74]
MKIYLGADHAGFELKQKVKQFLEQTGHEAVDLGAFSLNQNDDYPDFITPVAKEVAHDLTQSIESRGIIFGGSGEGEAMAANRIDGIRAAEYYGGPLDIVKLSRKHNNANVLSIGARFVKEQEAMDAIKLWLETPFSNGERHVRRIMKF